MSTCFSIAALLIYGASSGGGDLSLDFIPRPASVVQGDQDGTMWFKDNLPILYTNDEAREAVIYLGAQLGRIHGVNCVPQRTSDVPKGRHILFRIDASVANPEGYKLDGSSPGGIVITASKPAGLFYGGQTLLGLLPLRTTAVDQDIHIDIPAVTIEDAPAFRWRGLMQDCSRTFLSMNYLHRWVDLLASYKMNILHLHLTDDQGWRMEIKSHPELTDIGAKWDASFPQETSGFYTQEEMKELIAYAASRNVMIVPEIEMPSHCLAALAAHPELSCKGEAYRIVPYMQMNPTTTPYGVFCVGNEDVYRLMEDVLTEVIALFPSPYIHIGGDECPKNFWAECPKCQARKQAEGLKDENELQSYFVQRIEKFINAKGRTLLGWDEILEGGLAPNAVVMSWRGIEGGISAARDGHDVVMSPTSHCYFDYDYMAASTEKVYGFNPIPTELTPEEGRRILGAQANMWTHIARTEPDIDAQILPRLLALAEALWTPKEKKDWPDFQRRLAAHEPWLKSQGYTLYMPDPVVNLEAKAGGEFALRMEDTAFTFAQGAWSPASPPPPITTPSEGMRATVTGPDNRVWGMTEQQIAGGYSLVEQREGTWVSLGEGAAAIALAPVKDALWVVSILGGVFVYENNTWRPVPVTGAPGAIKALTSTSEGSVYALCHAAGSPEWTLGKLDSGAWTAVEGGVLSAK